MARVAAGPCLLRVTHSQHAFLPFLSLVVPFSPDRALVSRGGSERVAKDQANEINGVVFNFSSGFFLRFGGQRKHLASGLAIDSFNR